MDISKYIFENSKLIRDLDDNNYLLRGKCEICGSLDVNVKKINYTNICSECSKAISEGLKNDRRMGKIYSGFTLKQARDYLKRYNKEHYINILENINEITTINNIKTDDVQVGDIRTYIVNGKKQKVKVLKIEGNSIVVVTF